MCSKEVHLPPEPNSIENEQREKKQKMLRAGVEME
jgi:hypothetical protein